MLEFVLAFDERNTNVSTPPELALAGTLPTDNQGRSIVPGETLPAWTAELSPAQLAVIGAPACLLHAESRCAALDNEEMIEELK